MLNEQILLKVDSKTKEEWEDHVESSNKYTSVSQLIRSSVATQIHDDHTDSDHDESIQVAKRQILNEIDELDKTVNRIDNQQLDLEHAEKLFNYIRRDIDDIDTKWSNIVNQGVGTEHFKRQYMHDVHEVLLDQTDGEIITVNGEEVDFEEFFAEQMEAEIL